MRVYLFPPLIAVGGFAAASLLGAMIDPIDQVRMAVVVYAASTGLGFWIWFQRGRFQQELAVAFLLLAHLFWFALPALYQALVPSTWFGDWIGFSLSEATLLRACGLIVAFFATNMFGYVVAAPPEVDVGGSNFVSGRRAILWTVGAFLVVGLAPYFVLSNSIGEIAKGVFSGRSDKPWALSPESGYEASAIMTFFWATRAFLVAAAVISGSTLVVTWRERRGLRWISLSAFLLASTLLYFDQGTRSIVAMAVLPVAVFAVLRVSRTGAIRLRLLITGCSLAAVLLIVTQLQLYYRDENRRARMGDVGATEVLAPKQQIDFFTETACAVVVRDEVLQGDLGEYPLAMFAANVIPRVLWPGKPMPETLWHYSMTRWGRDIWATGGNALPSVVGQYYINRGFTGVLWIGIVYGLVGALLTRWGARTGNSAETLLAVSTALSYMFVSFRFLSPGFHYGAVIMLVWAWFRHRQDSLRSRRLRPSKSSAVRNRLAGVS